MTLNVKAGPDGTTVGDCPFAHYVRMVLHEKQLDYELCPCTPDKKPLWLIETYGGSMPALRHRRECYVESDIIAQYLDFFFQEPPLSLPNSKKKSMIEAKQSVDGFFPAVAAYLKHTIKDEQDVELLFRQRFRKELKEGFFYFHFAFSAQSGPQNCCSNKQRGSDR